MTTGLTENRVSSCSTADPTKIFRSLLICLEFSFYCKDPTKLFTKQLHLMPPTDDKWSYMHSWHIEDIVLDSYLHDQMALQGRGEGTKQVLHSCSWGVSQLMKGSRRLTTHVGRVYPTQPPGISSLNHGDPEAIKYLFPYMVARRKSSPTAPTSVLYEAAQGRLVGSCSRADTVTVC